MNVHQIENLFRFLSSGSRRHTGMSKLKVTNQSPCLADAFAGGLIPAQNPILLILDDFSMGLDPGYRRLFIDYLREYVKSENKTIFTTSHIIQDMERLIYDVLIMDYNRVLAQCPISEFMTTFKRFDFELENDQVNLKKEPFVRNLEMVKNKVELYTYESKEFVQKFLENNGVGHKGFKQVKMELEDAFIGLTGKY